LDLRTLWQWPTLDATERAPQCSDESVVSRGALIVSLAAYPNLVRLPQTGDGVGLRRWYVAEGITMAHNFGSLVFTPVIKALQERYGSRRQYAKL